MKQRTENLSIIRNTLTKLKAKGLKLAIVTDAPILKAYRRLDSVGVTEFFDVVVTSTDTGKKKPSPEPFNEALKRLNLTNLATNFI